MAHQITAAIADHRITATAAGTLTAGTVEHWTLKATFDGEWAGLTKRCVFANGGVSVGPISYTDGMAVPWEAVAEPGILRLSFVGVAADGVEVVRTAYMRDGIRVGASGPDMGQEQREATEDIVVQAAAKLAQLAEDVDDFEAAETARATAERSRVAAEQARASSEHTRATTESARKTAENSRVSAESSRVTAEQARVSAEQARVKAEGLRATAEQRRETAETVRAANEQARQRASAQAVSSANNAAASASSVAATVQAKLDAGELTGQAGFSPTATVTKSGSVTTITMTDVNGTTTATVSDGVGGVDEVGGVTKEYVDAADALKQDKLVAGNGISIGEDGKTISSTVTATSGCSDVSTDGTPVDVVVPEVVDSSVSTSDTWSSSKISSELSSKQDKLVAGEGIFIASDGKTISSTATVASGCSDVSTDGTPTDVTLPEVVDSTVSTVDTWSSSKISSEIALKQDKLVAGDGISIGEDGKTISSTATGSGSSDVSTDGTPTDVVVPEVVDSAVSTSDTWSSARIKGYIDESVVGPTLKIRDHSLRFAVATDIHWENGFEEYTGVDGYGKMQLLCDSVNGEHHKKPFDFLLITGDVYDAEGTKGNKAMLKEWMDCFSWQYEMPVIPLPGNHDQVSDDDWAEVTGFHRRCSFETEDFYIIWDDTFGDNIGKSWLSHWSVGGKVSSADELRYIPCAAEDEGAVEITSDNLSDVTSLKMWGWKGSYAVGGYVKLVEATKLDLYSGPHLDYVQQEVAKAGDKTIIYACHQILGTSDKDPEGVYDYLMGLDNFLGFLEGHSHVWATTSLGNGKWRMNTGHFNKPNDIPILASVKGDKHWGWRVIEIDDNELVTYRVQPEQCVGTDYYGAYEISGRKVLRTVDKIGRADVDLLKLTKDREMTRKLIELETRVKALESA